MDPLTLTELDAYEVRVKEVERALKEDFEYFHLDPTQVLRVIAAARASIPRPIADAPRDGTRFDLFVPDLSSKIQLVKRIWRIPNCSYDTDGSLRDGYGDLVASEHREELIKQSTWLPIPKGGAS